MPRDEKLPYIQVIGGSTNQRRLNQFKSMLSSVGVPKEVTQILIESPIGMKQARKMYNVPDNRPAFSVYNDGRVYAPQESLDNPQMIHDYLLHEFGHFAKQAYPTKGNEDALTDAQIRQMEAQAESGAKPYRDAYKNYLKNQKSEDALFQLQDNISSMQGTTQSTSAPIATQLQPPPLAPQLQMDLDSHRQQSEGQSHYLAQPPATNYTQRVIASQGAY